MMIWAYFNMHIYCWMPYFVLLLLYWEISFIFSPISLHFATFIYFCWFWLFRFLRAMPLSFHWATITLYISPCLFPEFHLECRLIFSLSLHFISSLLSSFMFHYVYIYVTYISMPSSFYIFIYISSALRHMAFPGVSSVWVSRQRASSSDDVALIYFLYFRDMHCFDCRLLRYLFEFFLFSCRFVKYFICFWGYLRYDIYVLYMLAAVFISASISEYFILIISIRYVMENFLMPRFMSRHAAYFYLLCFAEAFRAHDNVWYTSSYFLRWYRFARCCMPYFIAFFIFRDIFFASFSRSFRYFATFRFLLLSIAAAPRLHVSVFTATPFSPLATMVCRYDAFIMRLRHFVRVWAVTARFFFPRRFARRRHFTFVSVFRRDARPPRRFFAISFIFIFSFSAFHFLFHFRACFLPYRFFISLAR